MGGTAVLIKGAADVERLTHRGPLARLFGIDRPHETPLGPNRTLIELPPRSAQPLPPAFKGYIYRTVGARWPATAFILEYLDIACRVYVRGEREGDAPPEWYVQLTFSSCAGMAQISAEVAAHWATKWWNARRQQIATLLMPAGFSPSGFAAASDELTFLPIGDRGYAAFSKDPRADGDGPATHFEIDASHMEASESGAEELLRQLETEWAAVMADGQCRCQLCDPAFDHTSSGSAALAERNIRQGKK